MLQSVDEALSAIGQEARGLGLLDVPPSAALGRVLAAPIRMDADSPPFDRALLDGFAVRSADAMAGARLLIVGRQDAGGTPWEGSIDTGECLAINTGGLLPEGADGVLMVEQSRTFQEGGRTFVEVMRAVPASHGIQRRGAHALAGNVVLSPGIRISSAMIAAGISAGAEKFRIWRGARVAVLSTGDELIAPGQAAAAGQIRNSNGPMLVALVREAGHEPLDLGSCGDVRELLRERLERGLAEADVLVVTGGMSMGTKDLVPPLLKELGVRFHVEKVRMKPGKPFMFGTVEAEAEKRRYVAGLPGNPVSAFVTFQLFARELLERITGGGEASRFQMGEVGEAVEADVFAANGDREFFEPCRLERQGAKWIASPLEWRGSADILSLTRGNALARRPANAPAAKAGELIQVLPL